MEALIQINKEWNPGQQPGLFFLNIVLIESTLQGKRIYMQHVKSYTLENNNNTQQEKITR